MTSLSSHVLLPLCLFGLVSACAHSSTGQRDTREGASRGSTVTADDIQRSPGESIEEMLRGRVAGVTVTPTADGGIAVRIRGTTSITSSTEPLYILDGMEFQPGPDGGLTGISANDIESIRVLKDPADTGMYGIRGANGVIDIKTKRPSRVKKSG